MSFVENTLHSGMDFQIFRNFKIAFNLTLKIFVQIFNQHCQENNLGKFKFNPDFYVGPFSAKNLEVRTEARTYKGRAYPPQPLIIGVDVIEDTMVFGED